MLADAPDGDAWEAFWLVGGRVADWGPLPGTDEVARAQRRRSAPRAAPLRPAETAQARIAAAWVAANEPYTLDLAPLPTAARVARSCAARARSPAATKW